MTLIVDIPRPNYVIGVSRLQIQKNPEDSTCNKTNNNWVIVRLYDSYFRATGVQSIEQNTLQVLTVPQAWIMTLHVKI